MQLEVQPEINDQFESTTGTTIETTSPQNITDEDNEIPIGLNEKNKTEIVKSDKSIMDKIYEIIAINIRKFVTTPEIHNVLRNMGTCVVNGVMEIISFYFPAPFMPLIASAAGMVIPFEPVITLRRRMPVNSYRRALKTAVSGFLNTFDAYKLDKYDDDPYMTRRFNRRFMGDGSKEKEVNLNTT